VLKRYEVRPAANGGEWATIVLDTERGFFAAVSDRGNYAYAWSDFGDADFRSFLIGLEDSPDYLHGKLMSGRTAKVFDGDATRAVVEEHLRSLPAGQSENELAVLADCDLSNEFGFAEWVALSMLDDVHDLAVRAPEPDCLAFCTGIFTRFVAMLREELRAEAEQIAAAAKEADWGVWATPANGRGGSWVTYLDQRWTGTLPEAEARARQARAVTPIRGDGSWTYEPRRILTDAEKHELAAGVEIR
jgi:hypothetical protein